MALLAPSCLPSPVIGCTVQVLALLFSAALLAVPAGAQPAQSSPSEWPGQAGSAQPVRPGAGPEAMLVPLQCRLREGPWQACRMKVEQVGAHWFLLLDGQTIEFRHDGRGAVTMQQQGGAWRPVNSRWLQDTSLCWDGVCAKGPIPLD